MFENLVSRVNELKEDFFKNIVEEKLSPNQKSSIFNGTSNQKSTGYNPGSISGILKENSEAKKRNDEIKKQIDEAKQKKSDNERQTREKESSIRETESSISSTKSEIGSLKGKLAELHEPQQSEYMTYKDGEEVPVVDEAAYTAAHDAYLIEKANLENQIEQKEQELEQLESNLDGEKSELDSLKQEGTQIDSEISTLEQELAANELQEDTNEEPDKQEEERIKEEEEKEQDRKLNQFANSFNDLAQIIEAEISALGLNSKTNVFTKNNIEQTISSLYTETKKAEKVEKAQKTEEEKPQDNTLPDKNGNVSSNPKADYKIITTDEAKNKLIETYEKIAGKTVHNDSQVYKMITSTVNNLDKDGNGKVSKAEVNTLINLANEASSEEELNKIIEDANTVAKNCKSEEEAEKIFNIIHSKKDLERGAKLARAGISIETIINVLNNPNINAEKVIQLLNTGINSNEIDALLQNSICAQHMSDAVRLAELGRSTSEIIEILNNSGCRKGMKHVLKLVEKGITTSEIIKIFNNSNTLMNLDQTVELASNGKTADEINDLYNDSNSIGNLETAIELAALNISAKNIKGMLNDENVKKLLTGSENVNNLENTLNENKIEEEIDNKEPEEGENRSNEYNIFKDVIANMEFNNVQEKDIFKILSGTNNINSGNAGMNFADNLSIIQNEIIKKRAKR